jgi:hypothetical protein
MRAFPTAFFIAGLLAGCSSCVNEISQESAGRIEAPPEGEEEEIAAPRRFSAEDASLVSTTVSEEAATVIPAGETSARLPQICPQLTWVQNQGNLSIWRANVAVIVEVLVERNRRVAGVITNQMRPGDTVAFMIDDGSNSDGIISCTAIPNF